MWGMERFNTNVRNIVVVLFLLSVKGVCGPGGGGGGGGLVDHLFLFLQKLDLTINLLRIY